MAQIMITNGDIPFGAPNWADCATTDPDAAEQFYHKVFGWTSQDIGNKDSGEYALERLEGMLVAGIYPLNPELRAQDVPPHWATYFKVRDVDATLKRVEEAGGACVDGPFGAFEGGKIAVIRDPVGALVRIWSGGHGHGSEVMGVAGAMMWNELCTREPDRAGEFYARVFDLERQEVEAGPEPYTILKRDNRPVAGILHQTEDMEDRPPSWDVYFASDDIDATVEAVKKAGGSVVKEPFDLPVGARIAVLQDPQGATFAVMRWLDIPETAQAAG
ncbi:VOC family protein [Sulfitobacter sabulilitoris]|uniref:VOC family protein n=1 Tax=Sulfitobacter sabulilitoris TaxID=2562655 RepID=UPI00147854F0|nr:VOC family protein [Sulfitobacter sabulilitoris]